MIEYIRQLYRWLHNSCRQKVERLNDVRQWSIFRSIKRKKAAIGLCERLCRDEREIVRL